MATLTSSYETYVRTRFILRSGHHATLPANACQPHGPQVRERTSSLHFLDLTDLLGDHLIAAGFRLYDDRYNQHIVFAGKDIKRHSVDRYSLKAIKRYCRLYLQKQPSSLQGVNK